MESRKIRRLEFISDKIEGGNCKREVISIQFGCPTKKTELVCGLPRGARCVAALCGGCLFGSAAVREVEEKEEREKKKKRKEKKRKKKCGKFSKVENFRGAK
jgi:hypothetical protein